MKNEILKLHKSNLIYFLLIALIIFSFGLGLLFNSVSQNDAVFGYSIQDYESQEDLGNLITSQETAITNLEEDFNEGTISEQNYERSLLSAERTLDIYNYLFNNELNYDDVQSTTGFTYVSRNKINFMSFFIMPFELLMIIFIIVITIFIFNYDFNSGVFKFIYSRGKEEFRSKLMLRKTLLNFAIIITIAVLGLGLMLVLAIPYNIDTSLIIFNDGNTVWTVTNAQYVLSLIASLLVDVTFWTLIFTALAMFIKNTYMLIIASTSFLIIFQAGLVSIPSDITMAITQIPVLAIDLGLSVNLIVFANCLKFIFAGLLYTGALYYFNNKDLA